MANNGKVRTCVELYGKFKAYKEASQKKKTVAFYADHLETRPTYCRTWNPEDKKYDQHSPFVIKTGFAQWFDERHSFKRFSMDQVNEWLVQEGVNRLAENIANYDGCLHPDYITPIKKSTYAAMRRAVKTFLLWAHKNGYIKFKPEIKVDGSKRRLKAYPAFEDLRTCLLRACAGKQNGNGNHTGSRFSERDSLFISLALDSGLRIGELEALCWRNLRWGFDSQGHDIGEIGAVEVEQGKTMNAVRDAPFRERTRKLLKKYRRAWAQKVGHKPDEDDWLFLSDRSDYAHITRNGLRLMFDRVKQRAAEQVDDKMSKVYLNLVPHDCRHVWALHLANDENVPLTVLQVLGGWSDLNMVQLYGQPTGARALRLMASNGKA